MEAAERLDANQGLTVVNVNADFLLNALFDIAGTQAPLSADPSGAPGLFQAELEGLTGADALALDDGLSTEAIEAVLATIPETGPVDASFVAPSSFAVDLSADTDAPLITTGAEAAPGSAGTSAAPSILSLISNPYAVDVATGAAQPAAHPVAGAPIAAPGAEISKSSSFEILSAEAASLRAAQAEPTNPLLPAQGGAGGAEQSVFAQTGQSATATISSDVSPPAVQTVQSAAAGAPRDSVAVENSIAPLSDADLAAAGANADSRTFSQPQTAPASNGTEQTAQTPTSLESGAGAAVAAPQSQTQAADAALQSAPQDGQPLVLNQAAQNPALTANANAQQTPKTNGNSAGQTPFDSSSATGTAAQSSAQQTAAATPPASAPTAQAPAATAQQAFADPTAPLHTAAAQTAAADAETAPPTQVDQQAQALAQAKAQAKSTPSGTQGQSAQSLEQLAFRTGHADPLAAGVFTPGAERALDNIAPFFSGAPNPAVGQQAVRQVKVQIGQAVRQGSNEFTVRLDPPELGRVTVRLNFLNDGSLQASVFADNQDTLNLLQRDQKALEKALSEGGHSVDSDAIDYQLDDDGQQSAGRAFADALLEDQLRAEQDGLDGDLLSEFERRPLAEGDADIDSDIAAILGQVDLSRGIDIRV